MRTASIALALIVLSLALPASGQEGPTPLNDDVPLPCYWYGDASNCFDDYGGTTTGTYGTNVQNCAQASCYYCAKDYSRAGDWYFCAQQNVASSANVCYCKDTGGDCRGNDENGNPKTKGVCTIR